MAYYDALIAKWPTVAGTTTDAKLVNLRTETVAGAARPMLVPSWEVYDAIVTSEFTSLAAALQTRVRDVLSQGTINLTNGKRARTELQTVFAGAAGPTTRANLGTLAASFDTPQVPWLTANGYPITLNENDLRAAGLI